MNTVRAGRRGPSSLCAMVVCLALGCAGPDAPPAPSVAGHEPDQVLGQFTMDSFEGTRLVWSLKSPGADIFEADHRVDIDAPDLRFFSQGQARSTLTAARGRFETDTANVWAGGGVVLVSTDGARLVSDWMYYDRAADRVTSTAPVTITRGRSVLTGVGWEARPDLSELLVRRQRGEIDPDDASLWPLR